MSIRGGYVNIRGCGPYLPHKKVLLNNVISPFSVSIVEDTYVKDTPKNIVKDINNNSFYSSKIKKYDIYILQNDKYELELYVNDQVIFKYKHVYEFEVNLSNYNVKCDVKYEDYVVVDH